ncbi:MAG: hypothetical protein F6K32_08480 [Desertifilum sp. SIO1I2]|nr:hypothetical protein [Desertifilum sp. SIO1I2]
MQILHKLISIRYDWSFDPLETSSFVLLKIPTGEMAVNGLADILNKSCKYRMRQTAPQKAWG